MQTSSPILSSRMFLPYLVMGECAHWYRLSSLDYISENKKSEISTSKLALMPNSKFLVLVEKELLKIEFSFRYKEMSNRITICPDFGGKIFTMVAWRFCSNHRDLAETWPN